MLHEGTHPTALAKNAISIHLRQYQPAPSHPFSALPHSGAELVRINLSEQTDMMDLLGADLPVAGGAPGEFAW